MKFLENIKNRVYKVLVSSQHQLNDKTEHLLILNSQILSHKNAFLEKITSLRDLEFSVYSQWGEDGIIDWIVNQIPDIPKSFVEFGVENYLESNTRYLLKVHNWSGLVIDGSIENIKFINNDSIYWRHDLTAINSFITKGNINDLISSKFSKKEIGLLSIDLDGNDYWIWDQIDAVNPTIIICEYNAVFGDTNRITVPYKDDFTRKNSHFSNLYFGTSLPALIHLAEEKGYTFLGTNSSGCNAFFVINDAAHYVLGKIKGPVSFPSKFREAQNEFGELLYLAGIERFEKIKHMDVFDLETKKTKRLCEFETIYSEEWLNGLPKLHYFNSQLS
ncbi:hypothetical protein [Thalassospira xiamenensis]|uniref:Uncharacterized protein n=1 Tax=Thalassospira xiamenensis TaxID=220697 RepID=A0A285TAH6_9PROT|nr:hypothetical protein [Thalassospira xiamenensis]SOC16733.1 hypothetical protein SAMN05428964_102402 [Thalassospira xiamenensis]